MPSSKQYCIKYYEKRPLSKWRKTNASLNFCARKQLLLSARLSHRNSVRPTSVCLFDTRVDQSKTVQARNTNPSPSAAWKTVVLRTVKFFFHRFEGGHPERGS